MDIDADRLDVIHKLGARYANELGADLRFESSTDRQQALQDVDFVINTASGSKPSEAAVWPRADGKTRLLSRRAHGVRPASSIST